MMRGCTRGERERGEGGRTDDQGHESGRDSEKEGQSNGNGSGQRGREKEGTYRSDLPLEVRHLKLAEHFCERPTGALGVELAVAELRIGRGGFVQRRVVALEELVRFLVGVEGELGRDEAERETLRVAEPGARRGQDGRMSISTNEKKTWRGRGKGGGKGRGIKRRDEEEGRTPCTW